MDPKMQTILNWSTPEKITGKVDFGWIWSENLMTDVVPLSIPALKCWINNMFSTLGTGPEEFVEESCGLDQP